jgi:protein-S-isoprenylcysteine O-methyltransferase Ste14
MVEETVMKREDLPALLHVLAGLMAMGVSFLTRSDGLIPKVVARPVGMSVFILGMALFTWALAYLKRAFLGNVLPVTDRLIRTGPYRWIRHPLYLGMGVALLGLAVAMGSLWGVAGVLALFLPAGTYRARQEEKALARRFGREWQDYAREVHFLLPMLW